MRIAIGAFATLASLWIAAPAAAAEAFPAMKVMAGMPNMGKGQWTINFLESGGAMPAKASICFDSFAQMARGGKPGPQPGTREERESDCTTRVIENTPARGVVEATCRKGGGTRTTITRDGPKSFLLQADSIGEGKPGTMKARYTYEGPCKQGGAAVQLGKDSPQCQQMRAMGGMDPARMCANAGAQRQMCEEQIRNSLAQMKAMCQ